MKKYIEIENIHKIYGKSEVLKGISLSIDEGSFFGVFGKNGAGKTTLFKILLGLISPSSGSIHIDGKTTKQLKQVSIGYLPENISLYSHLSAAENLKVSALCAGYELNATRIGEVLESVNLSKRNVLSRDLSLGMKRRLQFAMATMTKPTDLLILDEPTNGMDVNGVLWLKDFLNKEKREGKTILVCSHSMDFMEDMIDQYCVINGGQIVRNEKWNRERRNQYLLTYSSITDADISVISELGTVENIDDGKLSLSSERRLLEIVRFLIERGISLEDITPVKNSLEKIFIGSVSEHGESNNSGMDQN